jgi:hypothetical protein
MNQIFNLNGEVIFETEERQDSIDDLLSELISFEDTFPAPRSPRKSSVEDAIKCWRRSNSDHLCRLNFDQGLLPAV